MTKSKYVEIDGHKVLATEADNFYHGDNGERLTDAEWDALKERRAELANLPEDAITWEVIA